MDTDNLAGGAFKSVAEWALGPNAGALSVLLTAVASIGLLVLTWVLVRHTAKQSRERQAAGGAKIDLPALEATRRSVLETVLTSRVLRVGCLWYPPFMEFKVEGGQVFASGLYPLLLQQIALRNNLRVEYRVLRWDAAIESIRARQVDVVCCVLQSRQRRNNCDFAGSLYRIGVGGVMRADKKLIGRHEDLSDPALRIAVTKGEIGWEYAETYLNLEQEPHRFIAVEGTQINRAMGLVAAGEADIALADSLSCSQFVAQVRTDGVDLIDVFARAPLHVEENSLMIEKGAKEFAAWLNEDLKWARKTHDVVVLEDQIERRYADTLARITIG